MTGDREVARDLTQQTYADAWAARDQMDPGRNPAAWLFTIAVNNARDWLRSAKRGEVELAREVTSDEAALAGRLASPESACAASEDRARLQAAVACLPAKYREILILKDQAGLSFEELELLLGLPPTTLKMRALRARALLRTSLSSEERVGATMKTIDSIWASVLSVVGAGLLVAACGGESSSTNADAPVGGDVDGGGVVVVDGGGGDLPDSFWPLNDAGQPMCDDKETGTTVVCQCADTLDNDSDGAADSMDIHCSGPFDNDESSFATGIPGDNSDPWAQDCFFDGDSGGGNDGCRWDIRCLDTTEPYEGQYCNNNVTEGCDYCRTMTPNGCDCFGCCDVFVDGVAHRVRIVETCTAAEIANPDACPPCEFVTDCYNPCDPCVEQCLGNPPPAENPACAGPLDAGTPPEGPCPDGITPCEPVDNSCPAGFACVTGCCQYIVP